jgi:heat shock protein HslJ
LYKNLVLLLVVCCVAACGSDDSGEPGADTAPGFFEVANATYTGIYDQPLTLSNGEWKGRPFVDGGAAHPSVILVRDFHVTGDLDGDGRDEAVVLLAESSGGSGTFQYLAVVGRSAGGVSNLGTAAVGDRVQTIDCVVENGSIVMDVVQAGPDDAMCCPTQVAHRQWRMEAGALKEISTEVTGKLSVAILEGAEWVLDSFSWEERAPEEPEITLTFEGGRAAGAGGCNRYFANVGETSPGEISFGQIGATMMACPEDDMALEQRYHRALEGVTGYSFIAGKLALTYYDDGSMRTLLFRRR